MLRLEVSGAVDQNSGR